ncbi:MAG: hypothetical protein HW389_3535 [Bacteroidetes bacterium]|nr:hypothetical protein [Bacteroidota bacterium]
MADEKPTGVHQYSLTLNLFPNSGHHFAFLPFQDEFLQQNAPIAEACKNENLPWQHIQNYRFIRFRYGSKDLKRGLWVAVESNLGRQSRGWVLEPERSIAKDEAKENSNASHVATPYAFTQSAQIPVSGLQEIILEIDGNDDSGSVKINLSIVWLRPIADPIDVDLIVDFGNTRTVALALEHNQAADESLSAICQPIRFLNRWEEYSPFRLENDPSAIIDSWFVLQEPLFANLEPNSRENNSESLLLVKDLTWGDVSEGLFRLTQVRRPVSVTLRVPQMFVEMSPALFGRGAAAILTGLDLRRGGNFFMSSPKRYLWDTDPVGNLGQTGTTEWTMNLNRWHPLFKDVEADRSALPKLAGVVLRFIDESGRDWTLGDDGNGTPPNEENDPARRPFPDPDAPRYPRSEGITWNALTILEAAYRQITSPHWRELLGQRDVPRRLRDVLVTFPPGWTRREVDLYRSKWQKAVDIFALTHFEDRNLVTLKTGPGHRPMLRMDLDEAVASQLPFVYGEIRRMNNQGENWLALVGRGRGANARARILNIDIGGGTTDFAIVEYHDRLAGPGVNLSAELLFRDSSTVAGDFLVKRIIEAVLLPAIGDRIKGNSEMRRRFEQLLRCEKRNDRGLWNRITLLVFIPIVRWWLGNLVVDRYNNPTTNNVYQPSEMFGSEGSTVRAGIIGEDTDPKAENFKQSFNYLCESNGLLSFMLPYDEPLHYSVPRLRQCVVEVFDFLFQSLAKLVEAFDCDLVLVNGKPSELPPIRQLLEMHVPLLPHRMIFMKGTDVGRWYPLSTDGVIADAKTVTAAGAALYLAIHNGLMGKWKVEPTVSPYLLQRNYWGLMPEEAVRDFGAIILTPEQDENICELMILSRIGRRLLPSESRPEPVYQLLWKDRARFRGNTGNVLEPLNVTLRRITVEPSQDGHPGQENLEIIGVEGAFNGQSVSLNDVELKLCSMDSEEYWMEKGTFDIEWPEELA